MTESFPDTTSQIAETRRIARLEVERIIARYRVALMGVVFFASIVTKPFQYSDTWFPTWFTGGLLAGSLLQVKWATRKNLPDWYGFGLLLLDIVCASAFFPLMLLFESQEAPSAERARWAVYFLGPALLVVLFVASLRHRERDMLIGGILGAVGFLFGAVIRDGWHPAQLQVSLLIVLTGLLGVEAAKRSARELDTLSRLQLLQRFVPEAAADRVLRGSLHNILALGGMERLVTVMMTDLRGFTGLAESLAPQAVVEQLNAYYRVVLEVVEEEGGALDKFMGDGALIVFGLGVETPDGGATAALKVAQKLPPAIDRHNAERAAKGLQPLLMGIGVHTGTVVAGNLGVPGRRLEYTVVGDAVNIASRLESLTKELATPVLISAETVARLSPEASAGLRRLPAVTVRGRRGAVEVFTLQPG